jgi:hypothetical protein
MRDLGQLQLDGYTTREVAEEAGRRFLESKMLAFSSSVVVAYSDAAAEPQTVRVQVPGARYVVDKVAAWLCLAAAGACGVVLGFLIALLILT